jgi:hypothetical protein
VKQRDFHNVLYTLFFLHIDVSWEIWFKRIYEKLQKKIEIISKEVG